MPLVAAARTVPNVTPLLLGSRRVPLGWRMISQDRVRLLITAAGVGFAVVLILFLCGVYEGVKTESNGYVAQRTVDVWVTQNNSTNLIRSTSFLRAARGMAIKRVRGVRSITSILRLITTVTIGGRTATTFILGIDTGSTIALPAVVAGSAELHHGDIILDRAFARVHHVRVGESLQVQGKPYRISGLSEGTNAVITQFAFVSLGDAQDLLGFQNIVSFFLLTADSGVGRATLARRIHATLPTLNAFTAEQFSENNLDEIRTGLLPVLGTIAVFGGVVGTAVLTLLLYGTVLEKRDDYALLKAIGASQTFLRRLLFRQSLAGVACGMVFGALAYAACGPLATWLVPQLALSLSWPLVAGVGAASLVMGAAGAWLPIRKLSRVFPAEVFRA